MPITDNSGRLYVKDFGRYKYAANGDATCHVVWITMVVPLEEQGMMG